MHTEPKEILKQYWGYDAFRPLQEEIIHSILAKQDTLALLPTGGGKSICFQVPALAQPGLCIVISPLIALMKDQVENLERRNIPALSLFTGMTSEQIRDTLQKANSGKYTFLYCSPERLLSPLFLEYLPNMPISFIAVDEAHCISQWGYDFRPSYLEIARIRKYKPNVPILALTASATPEVRKDMMDQLKFKNQDHLYCGSFARANLSYHVMHASTKLHTLLKLVKNAKGSGIVYCKSRRRTQEIASLLQGEKISADFYHAGLVQEVRNEKQNAWIKGEIQFIVCTNAFGMGIDKPDVRTVIHIDCPDSPEHYYQEAGRGGRDGEKAWGILLTDDQTAHELKQLPETRYPSIQVIRKTYEALCNYFSLPAGLGEGRFFDFDMSEFTKRFSLPTIETIYALQTLEQENILLLTEQLFIPSKLQFTTDRNTIEWMEETYPETEPVIKALLRTYSGIWDQPTSIFERQVCKIVRRPDEHVKTILEFLHHQGIVHYTPSKDHPQVRMLQNRVKTEDLHINFERYYKRKEAYSARIEAMVNYIENETTCRSKQLCHYFGDEVDECGHCDVCKKKQKISKSTIIDNIKKELVKEEKTTEQLLELMLGPNDNVLNALRTLLDENEIEEASDGKLKIKK